MADPKFPKYTPPEGWHPFKDPGKKTDIGKGNRPAPKREGESDADFQKRQANWMKSYQARGGVKIAEMNQGQLNKFAASGGPRRTEMMNSRISQYMEKNKPRNTNSNPSNPNPGGPDMSSNPGGGGTQKKENPTPGGRTENPGRGGQGMTARGGSAQSTGGFGGPIGAAGSSLARMPGRRARRRARRMAGRG